MSHASRSAGVPPTVLAMTICDHVWRDPCEGKWSILGTFDTLSADSFPFRHPVVAVYFVLTNGHGTVPLTLRLIDVDESSRPIVELQREIRFTSPQMTHEEGIEIPWLVFPRPGAYRLQLLAAGELLIERRLEVGKRL